MFLISYLRLLKKWYLDIWFTNEEYSDKAMHLSEEQIAFNIRLEDIRSEEE
jgi:hypothetical protein